MEEKKKTGPEGFFANRKPNARAEIVPEDRRRDYVGLARDQQLAGDRLTAEAVRKADLQRIVVPAPQERAPAAPSKPPTKDKPPLRFFGRSGDQDRER